MATAVEIMNTIRANSDAMFQDRIPEVTRDNLAQIGNLISQDVNIMNTFMNALVNRIAFTIIKSKMYKNPLAKLKTGGTRPLGNTIEEIFINPAIDVGYSPVQTELLQTTKPDGKTAYYGLNRQGRYKVTVNASDLRRAFVSEGTFSSFFQGLINSLYSGDEIDEFILCKNVIGKTADKDVITVVETDLAQPKELSKAISNVSKGFGFVNTIFAPYNKVNATAIAGGETPCKTWCPTNDQCLLLRADAQTEMDYEVLANMFHIELGQLNAMTILFDSITSEKYDIQAVLCDKTAIQMIDNIYQMKSMDVGSSIDMNYWLHHWQTIYISMFSNIVIFGKAKV